MVVSCHIDPRVTIVTIKYWGPLLFLVKSFLLNLLEVFDRCAASSVACNAPTSCLLFKGFAFCTNTMFTGLYVACFSLIMLMKVIKGSYLLYSFSVVTITTTFLESFAVVRTAASRARCDSNIAIWPFTVLFLYISCWVSFVALLISWSLVSPMIFLAVYFIPSWLAHTLELLVVGYLVVR